MAQHVSRQSLPIPPQPFSESREPAVVSSLFWARLLAYRPLFLLGGLWVVLVFVAAIAYHGLMFNERVDSAPQETMPVAPLSVVAPPERVDLAPQVEPAATETSHFSAVTLWGLVSLLGLCGFGCFVLTQQIKLSARPKPKSAQPRLKAKSAASLRPPQPKRLAPYSPERDSIVAPGARIVESLPDLRSVAAPASRSAAQIPQPGTAPWPRRIKRSARRRPLASPAVPAQTPAVVPRQADLPLDWPEGSVAHALDMRQRRSLSSYM
ncbi:hypothetical protein IQ254_19835 [Nodosilinea sp. LEGE 07088]|uniref:hypothetical protein n=1 Tax=Nodosilinea sp. LEGE 07088 TaxID=2777968 RepID=UPI0019FF2CD2|nr:hypothetical protein [Nodosilinea sp. LEGE 07088]MBE9139419.1 hypothetical protein [Nodosilinea sp. LEGE 07088]